MNKLSKLIIVLFLTTGLAACSDFLNPSTPQSKPIESVESVSDLTGLMNGTYSRLAQEDLYGRDYVLLGEVRTSNAFSNGNSGRFINQSMFRVFPNGTLGIWDSAYEAISNTNIIINSDVEGEGVDQVKGEAYAVRALTHTILLKMYGQRFVDGSNLGIPYVTTFGKEENFFPERPTVEETQAKIITDYKKAISLLNPTINKPATRMTYYAAKALLARFYLYTGNYSAASQAAKDVIDSGVYSLVPAGEYVSAWENDGQPSVLFGIAMTATDNRGSASLFQMVAGDAYGDVEATKTLYEIYGSSDVRKKLYGIESDTTDGYDVGHDGKRPWNAYRMAGKYQSRLKNTPVIRYAEVILIYAEAEARTGNLTTALTYLNKIPAHRNADLYTAVAQDKLIDKILLERRMELAFEGHYYWDLLRTGQNIERTDMRPKLQSNEVSVPYGNYELAYPIPVQELDANPNLQQNTGYGS